MARTVVVTGGTKGIGASIAKYFVEKGDRVVICARTDNGYAAELGKQAMFVAADVTRPSDLSKLVESAVKWTGQVDVFINNAGFSRWMSVEKITEDFWQQMLDVNTKSVIFGCQQAARVLKKGGCIINVSSMAAKRGTANNSVYCAAKFAVNGITQALAKELGPRGIRVNAVCPVLITTPGLMEALNEPQAPGSGDPQKFLADFTKGNAALGALPTGEQVAEFCYYLASASAVTGQCINVDCGVFPQ
jgi:3-oxoacyl-[acyl-carrier protein] reductase/meso-butanediol dehydrogenase/(S,S)-butanediol dehydrogenase/diacetyl reductase